MIVPRQTFPLEPRDMAAVFAVAFRALTGYRLDRRMGACMLSVIGVENGNGKFFVWRNWGNIAFFGDPLGPRRVWEHPKPSEGQPRYFLVFDSHEAGARAFWRLMLSDRYRSVLTPAARGRPVDMVRELYRTGFVVGGEKAYERLSSELFHRYERQSIFSRAPDSRPDFVPPLVAAVSGAAAGLAWSM